MKGLETRRGKGEKWKRKEWEIEKMGKENGVGDENYQQGAGTRTWRDGRKGYPLQGIYM